MLSKEWKSDVEGMGADDRDRLLRINALQEYRDLWPSLVSELIAAVPTGDLNQLKSVKRENRKQIVLDSIQSKYYPDVRGVLAAPAGEEYRKYMGKEMNPGDSP